MGKMIVLESAAHGKKDEGKSVIDGATDATAPHKSIAPRVLKGEEAKRIHEILTRPARKHTPEMQRAIETYKRLMLTPRSR